MKKTIYALTASAFLTSAAFAADDMSSTSANPATCANFSGFTLGGLLGYGSGNARTTTHPTIAGVTGASGHSDISINGINGGVILGYGKAVSSSKVYLGLDVSYVFDSARGKVTLPGNRNIVVKRQDSFDIDGRVGLVWANALPYLFVGWANSKAQASNFGVKYINKRLNGFNVGAGVDFKLTRHIVTGLVYKYTTFSKSGTGVLTSIDGVTPPAAANNTTLRSHLGDNKFQIKLAYQF